MESMSDWYGLKAGHRDFYIENDVHARLLFARSQLDEQLQGILRKSSVRGIRPSSCCMAIGGWARLIQCVTSSTS